MIVEKPIANYLVIKEMIDRMIVKISFWLNQFIKIIDFN